MMDDRRGIGPRPERRKGDVLWKWVWRTIYALVLALVGGVGIGIGDIVATQATAETSVYWARWSHGVEVKLGVKCP